MNRSAFFKPSWLVLLLVFSFFAWWAFGQSAPLPAPEVAVVAPFANDIVQDSIVVIAKPENPETVSKTVVRLEQGEGATVIETKELSPSNHWMTELDSKKVSNGSSNVVVESCSGNNCSTQTVPVQVQNPTVPSETPTASPSGAVPPIGATPPSITSLIQLVPSNVAGAFYLFKPGASEPFLTSSGDALSLEPGTYGVKFVPLDSPLKEIDSDELHATQSALVVSLQQNVFQKTFSVDGKEFEPVQSLQIDWGLQASHSKATIQPLPETQLFFCLDWSIAEKQCNSAWQPVATATNPPFIDFSVQSVVIAWAKPKAIQEPPSVPPTVTPIVPIEPPSVQSSKALLVPSNVSATATIAATNGSQTVSFREPFEALHGIYDARLAFEQGPISGALLQDLVVDHNGILLEFNWLDAAILTAERENEGRTAFELKTSFLFSKGQAMLSSDFNASVFKCMEWSAEQKTCTGTWQPVSELLLFPGSNVFGITKKTGSELDYLLELLRKGKYSNRIFFKNFSKKEEAVQLKLDFVEDEKRDANAPVLAATEPTTIGLRTGKIELEGFKSLYSILYLQSGNFELPTPRDAKKPRAQPTPKGIVETITEQVSSVLGIPSNPENANPRQETEESAEPDFNRAATAKLPRGARIRTDVVAIQASENAKVRIVLPKKGYVNAILKCKEWDFERFVCNSEWVLTDLLEKPPIATPIIAELPIATNPVSNSTASEDDNVQLGLQPSEPLTETVAFETNDTNAAYAGASITIIDVQSYPEVGGIWEVRFTTIGKADLRVRAIDGTTWSNSDELHDLKFLEIACGNRILPYEWIEDENLGPYAIVRNYECKETGFEKSKVLTHGKHHLEFKFGEDYGFADNQTTTAVKTVAFFVGQRENATDLSDNVWFTAPDFNVYLPENDINVVKAWVELTAFSTMSSTTGTNEVNAVDINVNNTNYQVVTAAYTDEAAEPEPFVVYADVTNSFSGFSNPKLVTISTRINPTAVTNHRTNAHALKLYVTYQYTPTSARQIKTVVFPLGAQAASTKDKTFSYNAFVPETGVTVRNRWFEIHGFYDDMNTTDIIIQAAAASDSLSTGASYDDAYRNSVDMTYYHSPPSASSFAINTNQNLRVFIPSELTQHLSAELYVTYEYDSNSPQQVKTVQYFLGQDNSRDDTGTNVFSKTISIPDTNVSVKHVWAMIRGGFDGFTPSIQRIGSKIGSSSMAFVDYNVDAGISGTSEALSGYTFVHDMTSIASALVNGVTVDVNSAYGAATASAAGAILKFTYSFDGNSLVKQDTIEFFAGQSANGTTASNSFPGVLTYTPQGNDLNKTKRSAFLSAAFTQGGGGTEPDTNTDIASTMSGQVIQFTHTGEAAAFWGYNGDADNVVTADDNAYTVGCDTTVGSAVGCAIKLVFTISQNDRGGFSFVFNNPSADGTSQEPGVTFPVNGIVTCTYKNCGSVDTNLQYCAGLGCTNFYDINSVSGSPLELVTGTIPDSNSNLNINQSYDVNWTIKGNVDGTYELRFRATGTAADTNTTLGTDRTVAITGPNQSPDVNILRIDGYADNGSLPVFSYDPDGNLTIDFNVQDPDSNNLKIDLNFSSSNLQGTGTAIVTGLDLNKLPASGAYDCDDTNFQNSTRCAIDWNIMNVADGNYYILANVTDLSLNDFNASDNNFRVNPPWIPKCGSITSDQTWYDGNTYLLTCDVNVSGAGVDLNIQPGAILKYTKGAQLQALNSARIVATGTAANPIVFTSCADQNSWAGANTSGYAGCSGPITGADYKKALYIQPNAGMTKSDSFSYLKILDANIGIKLDQNMGSVHDNNFTNFIATSPSSNIGIYVNVHTDVNLYNNSFSEFSNNSLGIYFYTQGYRGLVHDNNFFDFNAATAISYAFSSTPSDGNIYQNLFTNFTGYTSNIGYGIGNQGTITGAVFDNNFTNFSGYVPTGFSNGGTWSGNIFRNRFRNWVGTAPTAIALSSNFAGSIYNNDFNGFLGGAMLEIGSTTFSGSFHDNNFSDLNSGSVILKMGGGTFSGDFHNNKVTNLNGNWVYQNPGTFSGNFYNNRILSQSGTGHGYWLIGGTFSGKILNNTIFNFTSSGNAIYNQGGTFSGAVQRNLFAYATTAFSGTFTGPISNNAYYNVTTVGQPGLNDQNTQTGFATNPFIADGTDKNFLLNTDQNGGLKLINAGGVDSNGVDINNFFNLKTTLLTNQYDTNAIDIGYHYDLNGASNPATLSFRVDNPGTDGNTYSLDTNFWVSGVVTCNTAVCGAVDTNLQYCAGQGCTNFYDINSVAGSPLQLMEGTIPDQNAYLSTSQSYDANWTIKGNTIGTYELRFRGIGTTTDANVTNGTDRTIAINPSFDGSFVLLLPSTGCTEGKGSIDAGVTCDKGYFEATDLSGLADQNKVDAEGQSSSIPFFVYDNQSTSSSDLNILLDLNQSLPGTLLLKVSKIFAGWNGTCTGDTDTNCLNVSVTATNVGKATYSSGTQDLNIFLWGDFLAATVGSTDRNVDSNSIAP